ncbi:MAG: ribokinase [Mastigocoleus sp.]
MGIIVFGSINKDLVARASHLPRAGETLLGRDFFTASGGKGANQAVAAARLGISTYMVGRVGEDSFGKELVKDLQASGVKTDSIIYDENTSSGVAIITVDDAGENHIVVIPGANERVNGEDIHRLSELLTTAKTLLLQLEIPIETVISAADAAHKAGVKVILDPAPAHSTLPDELYQLVNIITPNEIEASQLVGFHVDEESVEKAANLLLEKLNRHNSTSEDMKAVIIKLGAKGVFCTTSQESFFTKAFKVDTVDTTAAGDAFNGAFAAALSEGLSLQEAVKWGAAAGAIASTLPGAQPSLPSRTSFDMFLQEVDNR